MASLDYNRALLADIEPALQSQDRTYSWACSVCFHTLALAVAAVLLRELPQAPAPVYRMEILLSDTQNEAEQATASDPQGEAAPGRDQEIADLLEDSSRVLASLSPSIRSASSEMVEQHALSEPSIVQRTAQRVTPAARAQQSTNVSSSASDPVPVESPIPIKRQTETVASVNEIPSEAIERSEMTAALEAPASPATETIAKRFHDQAELSSHVPPDLSHDRDETTADAAPSSSIAPPADSAPFSDSSAASSGSPASSPSDTVAMNHPTMTGTVPSKSQYGWLMELLRRRIMSLQAYPRMARMEGWEGIVVVKTTIDSDGSLVDAVVTKSSGYSALDEDALQLMHRVCPVRLPQDLGKSQIAVLIPIRYRLDRLE
ncbi:MAG: TonB family protein [Nitrospira sp.]|nr:TonB family protein [Nitrospira sp.]